ncbi:hypothetical protein GQ457_18G005960 [Hibiscus cannabinus]
MLICAISVVPVQIVGLIVLVILVILFIMGFLSVTSIWNLITTIFVLEEAYGFPTMMKSKNLIKGNVWLAISIFFYPPSGDGVQPDHIQMDGGKRMQHMNRVEEELGI